MIKPNKKVFSAFFISTLLAGCASAPQEQSSSLHHILVKHIEKELESPSNRAQSISIVQHTPSEQVTERRDSGEHLIDDIPSHYSSSDYSSSDTHDSNSDSHQQDNYITSSSDFDIAVEQSEDSPNSRNHYSEALQNAIMLGDIDKVKAELRSGASVTATDQHGFTAIQSAAMAHSNGAQIIPLLVQYGANPNQTYNTAKMVPLQFVSNAENAQALIDAGANVNSKDIIQGTPLHHATKPEVAKVLLAAGADPNAKNSLGQTPAEKMKKGITYFTEDSDIHRQLRQQYRDAIEVIENYSAGDTNWNNETYDQRNDSYAAPYVDNTSNAAPVIGSLDDTIPQHYSAAGYSAKNSAAGAISTSTPMITSDLSGDTEIDFDAAEQEAEKLEAAQICPMQEYDWYYTGKECQNDLAHGKGKAINPFEGMYFEGMIEAGQPVEGTLYKNNKEIFEGEFKAGKPNGKGICFFEGAPEECKYYKGQRIDSLHKQRQEFDRQRRLNNQGRQSNTY